MAKVMAMLSGIATSNTAASGSCSTPIATNTATSTSNPTRSRRLSSGVIIRNTVAIKRPTAAQATLKANATALKGLKGYRKTVRVEVKNLRVSVRDGRGGRVRVHASAGAGITS